MVVACERAALCTLAGATHKLLKNGFAPLNVQVTVRQLLFHPRPQEVLVLNRKPTISARISLAAISEKSKFPITRA